jgi:hypothetical protein
MSGTLRNLEKEAKKKKNSWHFFSMCGDQGHSTLSNKMILNETILPPHRKFDNVHFYN